MIFAAVHEPLHACFDLDAPGPMRNRSGSAQFLQSLISLLASASPRGSSSSSAVKLRFEFSPAFEHSIQLAHGLGGIGQPGFSPRPETPIYQKQRLRSFALLAHKVPPASIETRRPCVNRMTCMSVIESPCPTMRMTFRSTMIRTAWERPACRGARRKGAPRLHGRRDRKGFWRQLDARVSRGVEFVEFHGVFDRQLRS
jgi:hypothetical protein